MDQIEHQQVGPVRRLLHADDQRLPSGDQAGDLGCLTSPCTIFSLLLSVLMTQTLPSVPGCCCPSV
jgi:hypothetical protein